MRELLRLRAGAPKPRSRRSDCCILKSEMTLTGTVSSWAENHGAEEAADRVAGLR
jgi:hypothetical protein